MLDEYKTNYMYVNDNNNADCADLTEACDSTVVMVTKLFIDSVQLSLISLTVLHQ